MEISFGLIISIAATVLVISLISVLASRYKKTTKDKVFIRTGSSEKVIMKGGAFIFPVIHDLSWVSLQTLILDVTRARSDALITNDKLKVDVDVKFYVRVKQTEESILVAVATLGDKVDGSGNGKEHLKSLIDGKLIDSLRNVAAKMSLEELHSNRDEFVQEVKAVANEELSRNGLELESVSLNSLTQTPKEFFDPDNGLDAIGLKTLTEQTEKARQRTNEIEQETRINMERRNLDADKESAELRRESEKVKADTESEIARNQAKAKEESEKSRIIAEQSIEATEIERQKNLEQARIGQKKAIEESEINRKRDIDLSNQDAAMSVAEKAEAKAQAEAKANEAREKEVQSAEAVKTASAVAEANRDKQIQVINAEAEAETEAAGTRTMAKAERDAAEDKAEGERKLLLVEKERNEIKVDYERALYEAQNLLNKEWIDLKNRQALLEALPKIISESSEAIKGIDSVKLVQMVGGPGQSSVGGTVNGSSEDGSSLPDQYVNAMHKNRLMAPLVDGLLKDAGINDLSDLSDISKPLAFNGDSNNDSKEVGSNSPKDIQDDLETLVKQSMASGSDEYKDNRAG